MTTDFDHVQAVILTQLQNKQEDYRERAWRTPLLAVAGLTIAGLLRGRPLLGFVSGLVVGVLWAGYYHWQASKDPREAPIFDLLRTRPHDIVWIYWRAAHREESAVIVLGLSDGTRVEVPVVGAPDELDRMIAAIAARAPGATVGFHHEHERRYFADPTSLRRDTDGPRP